MMNRRNPFVDAYVDRLMMGLALAACRAVTACLAAVVVTLGSLGALLAAMPGPLVLLAPALSLLAGFAGGRLLLGLPAFPVHEHANACVVPESHDGA